MKSRLKSVVVVVFLLTLVAVPVWAHSSSYESKAHGSNGCNIGHVGGEAWAACYQYHYNSGNYHNHVINHFIRSEFGYYEYRHKSHKQVYSFNCAQDPCIDTSVEGISHSGATEGDPNLPPPPVGPWPPPVGQNPNP